MQTKLHDHKKQSEVNSEEYYRYLIVRKGLAAVYLFGGYRMDTGRMQRFIYSCNIVSGSALSAGRLTNALNIPIKPLN